MDYKVNSLQIDDFGRPSGILAINKPADITSHDVVYKVRKALNTKAVGHAGALDPFATGLLVILVGKATKLADSYLGFDKEYKAKILFGIATDSGDTEGKIIRTLDEQNLDSLEQALTTFVPEYNQVVPVYSSIKINGDKLRELARRFESFELAEREGKHFVTFRRGAEAKEVELPIHHCQIPKLELLETGEVDLAGTTFGNAHTEELKTTKFKTADILVKCSKGTYIRVLAEDIGKAMTPDTPAMLIGLERTKVGSIDISESLNLEDLASLRN